MAGRGRTLVLLALAALLSVSVSGQPTGTPFQNAPQWCAQNSGNVLGPTSPACRTQAGNSGATTCPVRWARH
jgi:hypothetical protein